MHFMQRIAVTTWAIAFTPLPSIEHAPANGGEIVRGSDVATDADVPL